MYIEVKEECRDYLEALCQNDEQIQPGELQEHIAWMKEQPSAEEDLVIDKGRFAVAVPVNNRAHHEAFYREKGRFEILNVIAAFVCKVRYPIGLKDRFDGWPIEVTEDEIKIRIRSFTAYCEDKTTIQDKGKIGSILKSMSDKITKPERYWRFKGEHLYAWAEIAMEYSDEEIKTALEKTTESKIDSMVALENSRLN